MESDLPLIRKEIKGAIKELDLDLSGLTVLTEAATGLFALTASIALMAGASRVFALSKSSGYGTYEEAKIHTLGTAEKLGLDPSKIVVEEREGFSGFKEADIITNLGHVRPFGEDVISSLREGAVISYMCEAWEHRKSDLDLELCKKYGVSVCGVNEEDPRVDCFRETGILTLKMVLESGVSVYDARIAIISRDKFGREIQKVLRQYTKEVTLIDDFESDMEEVLDNLDLLIIADYLYQDTIVGLKGIIHPATLKRRSPYVKIIQYCGSSSLKEVEGEGLPVYPELELGPTRMARTLADVSYKAVIRLHAGGLKAGELAFKREEDHPEFTTLVQEMTP